VTIVLVLVVYAALLAFLAPVALRDAGWAVRAPGLAIALWQALCASSVLSVVVAGFALAVLSRQADVALAGAALTVAAIAWVGRGFVSARARARRQARRHAQTVALVGQPMPEDGVAGLEGLGLEAVVVVHPQAAAYCLPGRQRHRRIVVTTGALSALDAPQLRAVVTHEHAHLRGRHHLVLLAAHAFALAFPGVPLFRHARSEVAALVEMRADDVAAHQHGRATLATALLCVAEGAAPGAVLAVGGPAAVRRIRRMLVPPRPLCLPARAAGVVGAGCCMAVPLGLACCPVTVGVYLALGALHSA
jgi:Zn-dependent protease with chaperone function